MIGLALKIALGRALNALKALAGVAGRYPWQVALAASLLACAALWHGMTDARAERDAAIAAKVAQAAEFTAAMAEAERLENERLARVTAQQERISADALQDFNRRIADARAHAARLRDKANRGQAGGVQVPGVPVAACRIDEAPGLGLSAALVAQEQGIQLDELISWIEHQAGVE
jgi:hypothetical protein